MSAKNVKRYDEHFKEKVTENKRNPSSRKWQLERKNIEKCCIIEKEK